MSHRVNAFPMQVRKLSGDTGSRVFNRFDMIKRDVKLRRIF